MKKMGKIFISVVLSLVLTMGLCVTSFALDEYTDGAAFFDFGATEVHLALGDTYELSTMILCDERSAGDPYNYNYSFSIYFTGDKITSKDTYFLTDWKMGANKVIIHIGKDETAKKIGMQFYVDDTPYYGTVNISIVDPIKSDVTATRNAAYMKNAGKKSETKTEKANSSDFEAFYAFIERHPEMDFSEILAAMN